MSEVQVTLTAEQLAAAYAQFNKRERQAFLQAIFDYPEQPQAALDFLTAAQQSLQQKFSPAQQRQLDRLLDKNAAGKLRPAERQQLDELMAEYGAGLIEKARAKYLLHLAQQPQETSR